MELYDVRGFVLVWKTQEGQGEVRINIDNRPDIVIQVQSAAELAAWDELLREKSMKKVDNQGWLQTERQSPKRDEGIG